MSVGKTFTLESTEVPKLFNTVLTILRCDYRMDKSNVDRCHVAAFSVKNFFKLLSM